MDNLRLALLIIGIFIIAFIYILTRLQKQDDDEISDVHDILDNEPGTDALLSKTSEQTVTAGDEDLPDLHTTLDAQKDLPAFTAKEVNDADMHDGHIPVNRQKPEEIEDLTVIVSLIAKAGENFSGATLSSEIEKLGMHLDDRGIYQYLIEGKDGKPEELFALANILEPGVFDKARLKDLRTTGVILFLQLPGPIGGVDAFDILWQLAEDLATVLNASLCDAERNPVTLPVLMEIKKGITQHAFNVEKALYAHQSDSV